MKQLPSWSQLLQAVTHNPGSNDNTNRKEAEVSEFIPYACHYNDHTLLTKNGELLQTIKVTGFSCESIEAKKIELREAVRRSIFDSIRTDDYALWFHTIRRLKNLDPGGDYSPGFADYLNQKWRETHDWDEKYVNELYITIVHEGESASLRHPGNFIRGLIPFADNRHRMQFLTHAYEELERVSQVMLKTLELYGARRLGVTEHEGVLYSESLTFMGKIINLEEVPLPMPVMDISDYLPSQKVAFGFNAAEVSQEKRKHFGALLSIKEYKELSTKAIDHFLQLPQQFIVSQCIDFINREKAVDDFTYRHYITRLAQSETIAKASGLEDIIHSNQNSPIDYGEQQLTILLLEDSLEELDESVEHAVDSFAELGIVAMREDIRLEECFWAQLPGNFEFISRLKPINTRRVGGFASLYNFPAGKKHDNHWGPAVALFYTAAGTPYYFNFHSGDNGHTAIIGPYGAGKTVLLNFLCSEAQKYNGKLFFFDKERGSQIFINAIGGNYHRMVQHTQAGTLKLNPLLLADRPEAQGFLASWLETLMIVQGEAVDAAEHGKLPEIVAYLGSLPPEHRRLAHLQEYLTRSGLHHMASLLTPWFGEGRYAFLFDHDTDTLDVSGRTYGFEMGNLIREGTPLCPMLLYLLFRIRCELDGSPAMIVLDEAWSMLDNAVFAPRLHGWLDDLTAHNAIAILATESVSEAATSRISSTIFEHIATQIYLPNPTPTNAYKDVFKLTDKEFWLLTRMRQEKRHFLLKHGGEAVIASLDLFGMPDILSVLSGRQDTVELMETCISEAGNDPDSWLPVFQQRIQGIGS